MEQKERLINLIMKSVGGCARNWAEVIADHLLKNGVIVPPCKVGDTVYSIEPCLSTVFVGEVYEIFSSKYGIVCRSARKGYYSLAFHADSVGKTVFLSREEAEKALAERSKE